VNDEADGFDFRGVTAAELAGGPPLPPRPAGPPSYGLTVGGHVVELARRTPAAERFDPLKLVTGGGWPTWYPALETDRPRPAHPERRPPDAAPDHVPSV
jgi:hypothetical protein